VHAGALEGTIENVQTLNSMQASLIRALTAKMNIARDDACDEVDFDDDVACVDGDWDEACEDEDDDWGPEDLDDLMGSTSNTVD